MAKDGIRFLSVLLLASVFCTALRADKQGGVGLLPLIVIEKNAPEDAGLDDFSYRELSYMKEPDGEVIPWNELDTAPLCSVDFAEWLKNQIEYPEGMIEGMVIISFIVEANGTISHVIPLTGIDNPTDLRIVDFIRHSPIWNPATKKGKKVAVRMLQRIEFKITVKDPIHIFVDLDESGKAY